MHCAPCLRRSTSRREESFALPGSGRAASYDAALASQATATPQPRPHRSHSRDCDQHSRADITSCCYRCHRAEEDAKSERPNISSSSLNAVSPPSTSKWFPIQANSETRTRGCHQSCPYQREVLSRNSLPPANARHGTTSSEHGQRGRRSLPPPTSLGDGGSTTGSTSVDGAEILESIASAHAAGGRQGRA